MDDFSKPLKYDNHLCLVLFKKLSEKWYCHTDLRKWDILEDAMMNQMTTQTLNIDFNIIQFSQCFLELLVSPLESAQYVTYAAWLFILSEIHGYHLCLCWQRTNRSWVTICFDNQFNLLSSSVWFTSLSHAWMLGLLPLFRFDF